MPTVPGGAIGADYQAFAAISDVVDHRKPRSKIAFQAVMIEKGKHPVVVEPYSSANRAPPLEVPKNPPGYVAQNPPPPPMKLKTPPAPVSIPEQPAAGPDLSFSQEVLNSLPTGPAVPESVVMKHFAPSPQLKVDFVGEVMDMEIPCFEIVSDEENQLLSLVIKSDQKLKLKSEQKVVIRIDGVEGFYWFTGIVVPITVIGATALVFGVNQKDIQSDE